MRAGAGHLMGNCASSDEMKVHDNALRAANSGQAAAPSGAGPSNAAKPPAKRGAVGAKTTFGGKGSSNESIAMLPKISKDDALKKLILEAIKDNLLFRDLKEPEWQSLVVDCMSKEVVVAGANIVTQGDKHGEKFYVVGSGACTALVDEKPVARYKEGGAFGELALLYSAPRAATVRAKVEIVKKVSLFAPLSIEQQRKMVENLEPVSFASGDIIFKEGDAGEAFYVIQSGEVRCTQANVEVARIGSGGFFGERALIKNEPRAATVVALTNVLAYVLLRSTFQNFMAQMHEGVRVSLLNACSLLAPLGTTEKIALARHMVPTTYDAGATVFTAGERADCMFFVEDGECVLTDSESRAPQTVARGGCFGDSVLLAAAGEQSVRTRTATAGAATTLLRLDVSSIMLEPGVMAEIQTGFRMEVLGRIPILNDLPKAVMLHVAENLEEHVAAGGEVIIKIGEKGTTFYIVESGGVVATDSTGAEVGRRAKGEYFGELALLSDQPRAATVTAAAGGARLLSMSRETFEKAKKHSLKMSASLEQSRKKYAGAAGAAPLPQLKVTMKDLQIKRTLGTGSFGKVWMVRYQGRNYALKQIGKGHLVELGLVEHVKREKVIQSECRTPFVVGMVASFQDPEYLYLLMETVMGGEMFYYLHNQANPMKETSVRFYISNVICALDYMHQRGIVYRDLKPENLLIHSNGYLKVADFGFAKRIGASKTYTFCGTPAYMSPEQVMRTGHDKGSDWWAIGVLTHEMITRVNPFSENDSMAMFQRIVDVKYTPAARATKEARAFITALLQRQSHQRLSMKATGTEAVFKHPWFQGLDWDQVRACQMPAPFVPRLTDENDTRYFVDCEDPPDDGPRYKSVGNFTDF